MKTESFRENVLLQVQKCAFSDGQLQVDLMLSNNGDTAIFAISSPRRIEFDQGTGVLHLWLSDEGRKREQMPGVVREISSPPKKSLKPREHMVLNIHVPVDITRLVPHDDQTFHLEAIDLTKAEYVEIHCNVDDKPFYADKKETDITKQLAHWGTRLDIKANIDRKNAY
jgi:hypothetical protein